MKPTKLYVKTHNETGLKYLGKTEQDPFTYKGSGTYWKNHIKKHGYNVTTEVLRNCKSKKEVTEWGLYYSKLWNIVESKNWANFQPEAGTGRSGPISKDHARKLHEGRRRSKNSPEHIAALARANTGRKNSIESKEKMRRAALADPDRRENTRKAGKISQSLRSPEERTRIGRLGAIARWSKQ